MSLIILPTQLFPYKMLNLVDEIVDVIVDEIVYLVEEPRYFTSYRFHKLKLMYHRATMKKYKNDLEKKGVKCHYVEFSKVNKTFYKKLNDSSTRYFRPIDHYLEDFYEKHLSKAICLENLNFLLTYDEIIENKDKFCTNGKYYHDKFYKLQRTKLNVLMKGKTPIGNKWSFDTENRKSMPDNVVIPKVPNVKKDKYYIDAKKYVEKHFPDNYGDTDEWNFPIDTKSSINWLHNFFEKRIKQYGVYQDAVKFVEKKEEPFLFHSVLSPMMNIGLLPDIIVVDIFKQYVPKPINSYEGFIRQIIGWRNYVYAIYVLEPDLYNKNYLKHHKKISDKYWLANTGILPIDNLIEKIVKYSYVNHIERLMFLGNWFLINQCDPKEVHRIFMEWTIDAYDWVMVPNVMGMSQGSDKGKMMTRMYFSSSNYILKMSNIKKGEWTNIWDAKYYSFIDKHYDFLKHNYATARQASNWLKKDKKTKKELLEMAKKNI